MTDTTMLYRAGGTHKIHGGHYDYVVVPDDQINDMLADGWFLTTEEAASHAAGKKAEAEFAAKQAAEKKALEDAYALIAKHEASLPKAEAAVGYSNVPDLDEPEAEPEHDDHPPTKVELQQRLKDLGIPFHHKAGVAALTKLLPKE